MHKKRKILFLSILIISILGYISATFYIQNFASGKIRNILLISIDTCRADYLSCYGCPQQTTPNIDAIAEEGILFENVISPAPITLPAHSSMLTGTNPIYHGIRDNGDYRLDDFNITLAEILRDKGFITGAVVSAFVLDSSFGINQGFDSYNDRFEGKHRTSGGIIERKGDKTSKLGIEWIEKNKNDNFFLFLHYYDPHMEYEPPEPFASEYVSNLYAGEIAYTDYCIGQVLNKLKELDLYDSTLIIITGDHGEMLGEHGEQTHVFFIYQSAIKVPLIFKLPGIKKPEVLKKCVGLIDIVPTICGLLSIEKPKGIQGIDLSSRLEGDFSAQSRYLYSESLYPTKYEASPLLGLVGDRWKYIQTTRPELYDIINDPSESNNLFNDMTEKAVLLKGNLQSVLGEYKRNSDPDNKMTLDDQALMKLRGLGYVGGRVEDDTDFEQPGDDPKDLIEFHVSYVSDLSFLIQQEKYHEAERLCEKLLKQRPDFWGINYDMAVISQSTGNIPKAVKYFLSTIELKPDNSSAHIGLGEIYKSQGNIKEAIRYYQEALRINPDIAEVYNDLGSLLRSQGKIKEAINHYRKAIQINPDIAAAHNNLGNMLHVTGKSEEAIKHYEAVVKINPALPEVHKNLGIILQHQGRTAEAILSFKEALRLKPEWAEVHNELGKIYRQTGKYHQAIVHWRKAISLNPGSVNVLNNLAWILATTQEPVVKNSDDAIEFAEKACALTKYEHPVTLDTLAAAYAADGNFDQAVQTAKLAFEKALAMNNDELTGQINERLELYKQHKSFIDFSLPKYRK